MALSSLLTLVSVCRRQGREDHCEVNLYKGRSRGRRDYPGRAAGGGTRGKRVVDKTVIEECL